MYIDSTYTILSIYTLVLCRIFSEEEADSSRSSSELPPEAKTDLNNILLSVMAYGTKSSHKLEADLKSTLQAMGWLVPRTKKYYCRK